MTEIEQQLFDRMERLERELLFLRATVRSGKKSEAARVTVAEVAKRFGVSRWTVHRMQGEFTGLAKIKKVTETGRVYFDRKDYEKWLAERNGEKPRRTMIRRKKKEL